jgi:hypothetical protein
MTFEVLLGITACCICCVAFHASQIGAAYICIILFVLHQHDEMVYMAATSDRVLKR